MKPNPTWKDFLLSLSLTFDEKTKRRLEWVRWMREKKLAFLEDPAEVTHGTTPPRRPPDEIDAHP